MGPHQLVPTPSCLEHPKIERPRNISVELQVFQDLTPNLTLDLREEKKKGQEIFVSNLGLIQVIFVNLIIKVKSSCSDQKQNLNRSSMPKKIVMKRLRI